MTIVFVYRLFRVNPRDQNRDIDVGNAPVRQVPRELLETTDAG